MGLKTRFIPRTAGSIPSTNADQLAKPQGSCYIGEDEPIRKRVEDASMLRLRRVVLTSKQSGDAQYSHSRMKHKGNNITRDCVLGLMERDDSLSMSGRDLRQIIHFPLQRKETPSNAQGQPSNGDDERWSGMHGRVQDTYGFRRSTSATRQFWPSGSKWHPLVSRMIGNRFGTSSSRNPTNPHLLPHHRQIYVPRMFCHPRRNGYSTTWWSNTSLGCISTWSWAVSG